MGIFQPQNDVGHLAMPAGVCLAAHQCMRFAKVLYPKDFSTMPSVLKFRPDVFCALFGHASWFLRRPPILFAAIDAVQISLREGAINAKKNYLQALLVCMPQDWGSRFALALFIGSCDSWKDFPIHVVSQLHPLQFEEPLFLRISAKCSRAIVKKCFLSSQPHGTHSTQISTGALADHVCDVYKYL